MLNSIKPPLLFTGAFLIAVGCQLHPVSSVLDEAQTPYVVTATGQGHRLDTRLPVAPFVLSAGNSSFRGAEYVTDPPPGEAGGAWVRQNTLYYPQSWGTFEEYWFGWFLLDLFSIDRDRHVSPLALESQGVDSLFRAFRNDHFTAYYPPEDADWLGNALNGTGVDSVFGFFFRAWPRDTLVAAQVDLGSAAWMAGIRSDDRILRFDGRWAVGAFDYLSDTAAHRAVEIEYLHPGSDVAKVRISRSGHVMPTLFVDTLPGAVGYISINQFVSTAGIATDTLFQAAAAWLEAHTLDGRPWILDLRGNGGGTIETARNIASALVPTDANLMHLRSREYHPETMESFELADTLKSNPKVTQRLVGRKIFLLQDRNSASSSEILISALRENLGTKVQTLGETSYGKGIGQFYEQTPLDGFMAITCLHIDPMLAPIYHGIGIPADIPKQESDSAIAQAWEMARTSSATRAVVELRPGRPNFRALEWNRSQTKGPVREPLLPAIPGRPFPLR